MYEESSVDESEIGGQINVPGQPSRSADGTVEYNTLDEPIRETIVSAGRLSSVGNVQDTYYCGFETVWLLGE